MFVVPRGVSALIESIAAFRFGKVPTSVRSKI
jgi:hypothetical protein